MSVVTKKSLPPANGDFYDIVTVLSQEDQDLLHRLRTFLSAEVAPIINDYWIREEALRYAQERQQFGRPAPFKRSHWTPCMMTVTCKASTLASSGLPFSQMSEAHTFHLC